MITPSPNIKTRDELADLCDRLGIRVAAEVGTDLGVFACRFLDRWHGEMLLCVDAYEPYGEMPYDRSGDYLMAVNALMKYHGRVKIVREKTPDCALNRKFPAWLKVGFVYIDASHEYEAVKADLAAWWEVLEPGGIFAGHDYCQSHPGVVRAVTEFSELHGLEVFTTRDSPASWFAAKPRFRA